MNRETLARIEGLRDLQAKLRSIDAELPKAFRGTIRQSGNAIRRDWKAQVPKERGQARRSMRVDMDREGLTGTVGSKLFYLRFREFGTQDQPARPALFPAAEREVDAYMEADAQHPEGDLPVHLPRGRARHGQQQVDGQLACALAPHRGPSGHTYLEVQRAELKQGIEAQEGHHVPVAVYPVAQVQVAAQLHRVGGKGQIAGEQQAQIPRSGEGDGDAPQPLQPHTGRRLEGRVEAPGRDQEHRVLPIMEAEGHIAREGELQQARVVEGGIEIDLLPARVHRPQESRLQPHQRLVPARQQGLQNSEKCNAHRGRELYGHSYIQC